MATKIYHSPSPGLLRLIWAKGFYSQENPTQKAHSFQYPKNWTEKAGDCLRWGIGSFADFSLRNYNNPVVIIALTALVMFAVTIAFYPVTAWAILVTVLPFAAKITPAMLLLTTYVSLQLTITGIGLRALGRLNNPKLMAKYNKGELIPVYVGTKKTKIKV